MKSRLINIISILLIMSLSTIAPVYASEEHLYEDLLVKRLNIIENSTVDNYYLYEERFYYYANNNDDIPDYVLLLASRPDVPDGFISSSIGEFFIITGCFSPYKHGYYIYTPADDKIYTLEDAYCADIDGIEAAFEFLQGTYAAMIGDVDANFEVNIKDATLIQKYLVGLYVINEAYLSCSLAYEACDFNRDAKHDIKDATAIQKHIAGLR